MPKFKIKGKKFRGFTLIELLIVISIIAILAATASASWRNAQVKARDGKRKADVKSVQQALETYFQTNGKYPASSGGQIQCNITGSVTDSNLHNWGTIFSCNSPSGVITYMQQLPADPTYQATTGYYYSSTTTTTYTISALLENTNDADLYSKPGTACANPVPAPPARNYCNINP